MSVQNVGLLAFHRTIDLDGKRRVPSAIRSHIDNFNVIPFEIRSQRPAVTVLVPQTYDNVLDPKPVQVLDESEKVQLGPANRQGVDDVDNLHISVQTPGTNGRPVAFDTVTTLVQT